MKLLLFSILIIFYVTSVSGQADFRKGYIVKTNGDTLPGYINFQKEALNYSECNFKRFEIAFPVTYSPEKLKSYGIQGEKQYCSAIINGKPTFLEYLVKGKMSMLFLDKGAKHYFIKDADGNIVELNKGKTTDTYNNKSYEDYKLYLMEKMGSVEKMTELINNSKLEIASLTSLVSIYNESLNVFFVVPIRPKQRTLFNDYSIIGTNRIKIGPVGGINIHKFKTSANAKDNGLYDYIRKAEFQSFSSPVLGIYLIKNISKNNKISLQSQVTYQKVSLYGFSNFIENSYLGRNQLNYIYIDFKLLKIQGSINYSIKVLNFNLLPHIGAAFNVLSDKSYYRFNEISNASEKVVNTYEYNDLELVTKDISFFGGLSLTYQISSARIISLNIDYEAGNNVLKTIKTITGSKSKINSLKGHEKTLAITIGFSL
jgi:hypothetical protein